VPGTGDTTVNNFALAERSVLMLAHVRDGRNLSVVFENRHPFSGNTDDARAVFRDVGHGAGVDKHIRYSRGNGALTREVRRSARIA